LKLGARTGGNFWGNCDQPQARDTELLRERERELQPLAQRMRSTANRDERKDREGSTIRTIDQKKTPSYCCSS